MEGRNASQGQVGDKGNLRTPGAITEKSECKDTLCVIPQVDAQ